MAFALKLPIPKNVDLSKIGAQFNSWWNGVDIAQEIKEETPQDIENKTGEVAASDEASGEEVAKPILVETPAIPLNHNEIILNSDYLLWGKGRLTPLSDYFDSEILKTMQLEKGKKLSIFGAEGGAFASNALNDYDVKIDTYEQNSFLLDACAKNIANHKKAKSFSAKAFDGTPGNVPKNKTDALLMSLRGFNQTNIESHFFTASRLLKPNGIGFWLDFVSPDASIDLENLASPEGRSFATIEEIKPILAAAGLEIIEEEDVGAAFLNGFVKNQNRIKNEWEEIQAEFIRIGGANAANHALKQLMGWRARADAVKIGKLSLKKIVFCRA